MANMDYVETEFEEGEEPSSAKLNSFNTRIKSGLEVVGGAIVDICGDDVVINDSGSTTELKVTANDTPDMYVNVAAGFACVNGHVCRNEASVSKLIVEPSTNNRYTIIQISDEGVITTLDGTEAASPSEPSAQSGNIKLAAIYLPLGCTIIEDADGGDGYIIDRRDWPVMGALELYDADNPQLRLTQTVDTYYTDFRTTSAGYLTIDPSGGRVGIGVAAPTSHFHLVTGDAANHAGVLIDFNEVGAYAAFAVDSESSTWNSFKGKFALHVQQDLAGGEALKAYRDIAEAGSYPLVYFHDDNASNTQTTLKVQQDGTGDILTLWDGGTEVLTVLDGGNVGIGTAGPDRKLDVLDASNPQVRLTHTDGTVYTDFQTTSSGYLGVLPSASRVGVNTASPDTEFHVVGDLRVETENSSGASNYVQIYNNATAHGRVGMRLYAHAEAGNDAFSTESGRSIITFYSDYGLTRYAYAVNYALQHELVLDKLGFLDADSNPIIVMDQSQNVSIGHATASRRLDVVDSSDAQLRLTYASTTVYTDFKTDSSGHLTIDPTGGEVNMDAIVDFTLSMGDSAKDPTTDAPADWIEVKIGGSSYYVPVYAAS